MTFECDGPGGAVPMKDRVLARDRSLFEGNQGIEHLERRSGRISFLSTKFVVNDALPAAERFDDDGPVDACAPEKMIDGRVFGTRWYCDEETKCQKEAV